VSGGTREVLYPPLEALLEAHERLIERYGGSGGLRDRGGLEAALARAEQLRAYAEEEPSIFALAAALGYAIARIRHPFVDGNKRVAFYATVATLRMNGWVLDAVEREAAEVFEGVASGSIDEAGLVGWLERNSIRTES
jgi:death on curing protein